MFSRIDQDQIIAHDQTKEHNTTDDVLTTVNFATGKVDEKAKQGLSVWRMAVTTAMAAAWLGSSLTPTLAEENVSLALITEQPGESRSSIAQALAEIADRYESVLFSYPARVLEIEGNISGDPVSATLLVSIDGNDTVIRRPIRQFGFEIKPDMRLIVDGVQRGGTKQLAFRVAQPLQLDEEQEALLKGIVSAFKTGTNV